MQISQRLLMNYLMIIYYGYYCYFCFSYDYFFNFNFQSSILFFVTKWKISKYMSNVGSLRMVWRLAGSGHFALITAFHSVNSLVIEFGSDLPRYFSGSSGSHFLKMANLIVLLHANSVSSFCKTRLNNFKIFRKIF